MKDMCCRTCACREKDWDTQEWLCMNVYSDNYGMETAYSDTCEEWEERS